MDINIGDFFWYLSDVFTMGVQYGRRTAMCNLFANSTWNMTYPVEGLHALAVSYGVTVDQYDAVKLSNTTYDVNKNIRQWTW